MTLTRRFRKALFAFFKEEILSSVGNKDIPLALQPSAELIKVDNKRVDFQELTCELSFDDDRVTDRYGPQSVEMALEKQLEKVKKDMFEEVVKYIHTDSRQLFERGLYGRRRIRLSLWVGKLKWA